MTQLSAVASVHSAVMPVGSSEELDAILGRKYFDFIIEQLDQRSMSTADRLNALQLAAKMPTAYAEEALLWRYVHTHAQSDEERATMAGWSVGLAHWPPLRRLSQAVQHKVLTTGVASPVDILLLKGALLKPTRLLYSGAGTLLRSSWLEKHLQEGTEYEGWQLDDIVLAWGRASGVWHLKQLDALQRVVTNYFLSRTPAGSFRALDWSAVLLAKQLAPSDHRLATLLFRCLQRIAAYEWRGFVRWRADWLRGHRASNHAIAGASGRSRELTSLLHEHVLERVQGHSAGKKAATYKLRVALPAGNIDVYYFAKMLGVEVDSRGAPRRG